MDKQCQVCGRKYRVGQYARHQDTYYHQSHLAKEKRREEAGPTKTYGYTLYHDEPEDAAVNSTGHHGYRTRKDATEAAKEAMDHYWNGGATIEAEEFTPGEFGVRPDSYEFIETLAYVGPDGTVQ